MRELKFRAWDKESCKWCSRVDYDYERGWVGITPVVVDGKYIGEYDTTKGIVVEQYTGLKDKNGKEIYEGDICRLTYSEIRKGQKRWKKVSEDINRIEFEDGYFKFTDTDKYGIGSELSFSDCGEYSTADGSYKYEAEVIGNIHENKELLK